MSEDDVMFYVYVGVSIGLVILSGMMSGLTLGLLSIDSTQLKVLEVSGTPSERVCAKKVAKVLHDHHHLLVTLLLCNAAANEALPIFLDRLADPVTAVVLSVTVVLIFGEILPQAVCSRYGLQIGAACTPFVRVLMLLTWPLSKPLGRVLDLLLGHPEAELLGRSELKAYFGLQRQGTHGQLTDQELLVIQGALELTEKTAWTCCTPLNKVFMVSEEAVVDEALLEELVSSGHSRVPVHKAGDRQSLLGLLLVKELVVTDVRQRVCVGELALRPLPHLTADTPLYDVFRLFELGRGHMALLTRPTSERMKRARSGFVHLPLSVATQLDVDAAQDSEWGAGEGAPVGIITIEDVIEELLGAEIIDETDRWVDNEHCTRVDSAALIQALPRHLRAQAVNAFTPRVGKLAGARGRRRYYTALESVPSMGAEEAALQQATLLAALDQAQADAAGSAALPAAARQPAVGGSSRPWAAPVREPLP